MDKKILIILTFVFWALPALGQVDTTLVGYWKFDEGTGTVAYDASGYGNDGELMNSPTWVNGLPLLGKALDFDGTDDYVRINDNDTISSPSLTRAITVMAWVKPDVGFLDRLVRVVASHWTDLSGSCQIGEPSNSWTLEAHQDDGKYHSIIAEGSGQFINLRSKTPIKEGVWQHLAFTWDGSMVTFYFDGIPDTSATYTGDLRNSSCYMQIGKTDRLEYVWKGLIDEVKLYNRALSAEEIREEYERVALVGYWKFDEGSGTIAHDSSGYGNDGELMNSPTWVNGLPLLGKALDFDGTDDYVRINDNDTISSPSLNRAITVMAWVKPDVGLLDRLARVVASHWTDLSGSCQIGEPSNSWVLEALQDDGKYHSIIAEGSDQFINLRSKTPIKEGVWQHVAFTWDGSLITFYFDGVADTSASYTGNLVNSSCYLQIGKTDRLEYVWKGLIDEVKLYGHALSAEQIKAVFETGFIRGDANADGVIDVGDVVYLINYLFKNGSTPSPLAAGDANCDGVVDVGDVVYLINYLFKGGSPPSC